MGKHEERRERGGGWGARSVDAQDVFLFRDVEWTAETLCR